MHAFFDRFRFAFSFHRIYGMQFNIEKFEIPDIVELHFAIAV